MSDKAVITIVPSEQRANLLVDRLRAAGVPNADISVLAPDRTGRHEAGHQPATKSPDSTVVGGSTGALLGGTLGALVGIGALAIPGLGVLIAAGPLVGALTGVAMGGLTGGLVGLGVLEHEAKQLEERLKDGDVLVSVHTSDSERRDLVKRVFEDSGVHDIDVVNEQSAPKPSKSPRY